MNTNGITFIIPNWNHELVLPRSIRSALKAAARLREDGLEGEVLIVDDASRDGSLVLLRQLEALYYDQGLRVLALDKNVGPAAVRNLGLRSAGYRYAVFMDADNEIVHQNILHFYRSIRDTEAAAVYGNIVVYEPGWIEVCSHESLQRFLYTGNYIDTFSLSDVEQLLDVGAFSSELEAWEDWEFFLHLASCGRRLVHVPMAFGLYYRNRNARNVEEFGGATGSRLFQKITRIYNQFPEARSRFHLNSLQLRYHPELGYL
jgi:glycosyltransferase involved in cell wall biosynthesis